MQQATYKQNKKNMLISYTKTSQFKLFNVYENMLTSHYYNKASCCRESQSHCIKNFHQL